jgi:hypothetical protein
MCIIQLRGMEFIQVGYTVFLATHTTARQCSARVTKSWSLRTKRRRRNSVPPKRRGQGRGFPGWLKGLYVCFLPLSYGI